MTGRVKEHLRSYLFLAPFLAVFLVFLGFPVLYSFYLSLHEVTWDTDLFHVFSDMRPVGWSHYARLFAFWRPGWDSQFWFSLLVTAYYAVLSIPLGIALALLLAMGLRERLPGRALFRTAFFLPNVLDMLVVSVIWVFIYSPHYGVLDRILSAIGIHYFSETGVLGNPRTAMPGVVVAGVLKSCGFGMVLFLAALQNIPQSVLEAAEVDGATRWQAFRHVTLPFLRPILLFLAITGSTGALNAFTEIYAMTGGGPTITVGGTAVDATATSGYYLYTTWAQMRYGYAAAVSYVLLLITLAVSLLQARLLRSRM